MMNITTKLLAILVATMFMVGCANTQKRDVGLVSGGLVGGVVGNELTDSTLGTIGGAVGGAYLGREVGKSMEE